MASKEDAKNFRSMENRLAEANTKNPVVPKKSNPERMHMTKAEAIEDNKRLEAKKNFLKAQEAEFDKGETKDAEPVEKAPEGESTVVAKAKKKKK